MAWDNEYICDDIILAAFSIFSSPFFIFPFEIPISIESFVLALFSSLFNM